MARKPFDQIGRTSFGYAALILHSRQHRRKAMFGIMLFAMAQAFCGAVVLEAFLMRHPIAFLAYWGFCLGAVLFGFLLATFDLLAVRKEARARERALERELQEAIAKEKKNREARDRREEDA